MAKNETSALPQHGTIPATGVLLLNLGTPAAPTPAALRAYLGEFLWDPRVVSIPRPLWWLILHGVVLRTRPRKSAHAYEKIWMDEGSPLLVYSQRVTTALQSELVTRFRGPVKVALGMRYGSPSLSAALEELKRANCERLLILPLYPQYSSATTASTIDAVAATMKHWMWVPEMRFITHYHDEEGYITALARSIRDHWTVMRRPDLLLFSFHGMPQRTLLQGDPYHCQCQKTARLVAERLELAPQQWRIAFQSRFGREEWLKPYADETLRRLPSEGYKRVDVVCPGFAVDCLETLEEMAQMNRTLFLQAGGTDYCYIPALNERVDHVQALADLVLRHVQGWPEADAGWKTSLAAEEAEASRRRAKSLGAPD